MNTAEQVSISSGLAIHDFGIGRVATGNWLNDLAIRMREDLPSGQLFVPRIDPGVSYVSGHKIAGLKGFENHQDHDPDKLIDAIVATLRFGSALKPSSQERHMYPLQNISVSNSPSNRGEYSVYCHIEDLRGDEYVMGLCLHGERTAIEKGVLGKIHTKKGKSRAKVVLGSIATSGATSFDNANSILREVAPDIVALKPVGPISYKFTQPVNTPN